MPRGSRRALYCAGLRGDSVESPSGWLCCLRSCGPSDARFTRLLRAGRGGEAGVRACACLIDGGCAVVWVWICLVCILCASAACPPRLIYAVQHLRSCVTWMLTWPRDGCEDPKLRSRSRGKLARSAVVGVRGRDDEGMLYAADVGARDPCGGTRRGPSSTHRIASGSVRAARRAVTTFPYCRQDNSDASEVSQ
jgi:hypothetical protein